MALPLMPKATAVWLVDNTGLSFDQIAKFCGLHPLEVQAIADGEVGTGMQGSNPITTGQLTQEEIDRCEADPKADLKLRTQPVKLAKRSKGPRYTPVSKRQDKPNAIAYLLKFHSELSDSQITKLIGTTKTTIGAIRDRSHWNIQNIKAADPVLLGLCTQVELNDMLAKAQKRAEREGIDLSQKKPAFDDGEPMTPQAPADTAPVFAEEPIGSDTDAMARALAEATFKRD